MRSLCLFVLLLLATATVAHESSASYLKLGSASSEGQNTVGDFQWDIAARDIDVVTTLDLDGDGEIVGHEILRVADNVVTYLDGKLELIAGVLVCQQTLESLDTRKVQGRGYLSFSGRYNCVGGAPDSVRYSLLSLENPSHQLLIKAGDDKLTQRTGNDGQVLQLATARQSLLTLFSSFVADGMHHVANGLDHVLFLLLLLVPAVLVIQQGKWQPAEDMRTVLIHTAYLSAAFALGHGLSLTLAVLDWLRPDTVWVELGIAASIVIVALNNVSTRYHIDNTKLALLFGFVHGFGFSSVLSAQALSTTELAVALFGFNTGIELFQLVLVLAMVPVLFYARSKSGYVRYLLNGSAVLCALAAALMLYTRLLVL